MTSSSPSSPLTSLGPLEQLRAGRLGRRIPQLLVGLALYGFSMAMMLRSDLGLAPWDVLTEGLSLRLPLSFGTITVLVSALVLLMWVPLRQRPGLGTVANVFVVGIAVDLGLAALRTPSSLVLQVLLLIGGLVANGLAGAVYMGSQLGPGPRDGLMTGLARRTGGSLRLVRTGIEVVVLGIGFLLGGTVGVGTVLYAVGIGPLTQRFLPLVAVRLEARPTAPRTAAPSTPAPQSAPASTPGA
ncbi:Uncharacterized membrane protein YczE [Friedmanniella luteola]|uniref:Uncharacterized membrane protein YczE n=1 Tax=Friedmanniella luteola TaxID=546871 RepID=A0A1H1TWZ7_9ACTN|nr:hypothetical protein [Friedmanniella luteola]SDS64760.1 Uncharacterized membrane protein YczE [Friedmanniella luteola]